MILTIIKQFFIISSSVYLYQKLLNLYPYSKTKQYIFLCFSFILALISHYLILYIPSLSLVIQVLIFYAVNLLLLHTLPKLSFVITTIAFGLSNAFFSLIVIILITIFYWISPSKDNLPSLLITLLAGIFTYIFVHLPFKSNRLRKGMTFLYHDFFINSGLFISITILFFISLGRIMDFPTNFLRVLPLTFIFLLGFLLLFWWKNQITKSYLEKLRKAELESLRQEMIEKEAEIKKLRENNDSLARIIHRDNKLIPSMEAAVCELLENQVLLSADDFQSKGKSLVKELREMSASRAGILTEYQKKGQHIPITGVCSVDALFSYMQKKASSFQITFDVKVSTDLLSFANKVIPHNDLSHLLSDLIENAIIATKNSAIRKIQLHISFISNHYIIELLDTGEPFPIEILQGFGIEQQTSHADEGGSGIGLMDIWKLKKKYHASLYIQEFHPDSDSFQKKISFIFDSKNHYLIQTYRPQEILMTLKRSDLYVLENET